MIAYHAFGAAHSDREQEVGATGRRALAKLEAAKSMEIVAAFRQIGQLTAFPEFTDAEIWTAIQKKRGAANAALETPAGLKVAEWEAFSNPDPARNTLDFELRQPNPHATFSTSILVPNSSHGSSPGLSDWS